MHGGPGAVLGGLLKTGLEIFTDWDEITSSIKINRSSQTLDIKSIGIFTNQVMSYKLEGWTGRYSMPLEFLLSTHIATMSPDLSYKLATNFNTDVEILLWKSENNSQKGGVQCNGKTITSSEINQAIGSAMASSPATNYGGQSGNVPIHSQQGANNNPANSSANAEIPSSQECLLRKLEIPEPEGCSCGQIVQVPQTENSTNPDTTGGENEGQVIGYCDLCKGRLGQIQSAIREVEQNKFDTFIPYINSVTDHWFRDVYFTAGALKEAGVEEVIQTDEDYYLTTGEMWSSYEMDPEGEYELYVYFPDDKGNYKGTFETDNGKYIVCRKKEKGNYGVSEESGNEYIKKANGGYELFVLEDVNVPDEQKKYSPYTGSKDKFRVGKKAVTRKILEENSEWNAYELDMTQTSTGWKPVEVTENTPDTIKTVQDMGFTVVYDLTTQGSIKQVEDGVRGETHVETKEMFLDDYYLYDGNGSTAALIEAAKVKADSDDPDKFREKFGNEEITANYHGKQYGPVTIDEISGPINILQNSLTAFSMLKNMHTLDAEYIYHDFKELIVELDYFDKEELTEPEEEVMMFPIEGVSSAGWPMVRYDKSEEFYGTLLHSAEDYQALKAETIAELDKSGVNVDITQPEETATEQRDRSDGTQTTTQTATGHISYESIPANPSVDKCWTKSVVNGIEFYDYKQGSGSEWANKPYWGSTMAGAGCGPTSTAILLSGYGVNVTPDVIADEMVSDTTLEKVKTSLETHGVPVAYYRSYEKTGTDAQNCINDILEAFNQGKPVICLVGKGSDGYFTGGGHFMVLLGTTEDGTLMISNPGRLSEKQSYGSLDEFVKNYITHFDTRPNRGILVPADAPDGSTYSVSTEDFKGYTGGEKVLAPVTGEVIKYGNVSRKNLETGENETVGFIKIKVLGSDECAAGEECKYFNDIDEGYNYFWEEYSNGGITDHVMYIEGFNVSEILGNSIDSDNSVKGENIKKLKSYIENDTEDDFYTTKYEIPKTVDKSQMEELQKKEDAKKDAKYVIEDKKGKIYIKEGAVIGYTYTPEEAQTVENKIETSSEEENEETSSYKIGNYIRFIFRDKKEQVVENVENYMELEEPTQELVCGDLDEIDELGEDASHEEKIKAAVKYFVAQGFTVEAACGIMGNSICESTLDPASVSSTGKYYGLFQWDKDNRWPIITGWMSDNGYNQNSFAGQIRAMYESNDKAHMTEARWEELKGLTDTDKAAELFAVYHEGCVGSGPAYSAAAVWYNAGTVYQALAARKGYAQNAYKIYKGETVGIKDGYP